MLAHYLMRNCLCPRKRGSAMATPTLRATWAYAKGSVSLGSRIERRALCSHRLMRFTCAICGCGNKLPSQAMSVPRHPTPQRRDSKTLFVFCRRPKRVQVLRAVAGAHRQARTQTLAKAKVRARTRKRKSMAEPTWWASQGPSQAEPRASERSRDRNWKGEFISVVAMRFPRPPCRMRHKAWKSTTGNQFVTCLAATPAHLWHTQEASAWPTANNHLS